MSSSSFPAAVMKSWPASPAALIAACQIQTMSHQDHYCDVQRSHAMFSEKAFTYVYIEMHYTSVEVTGSISKGNFILRE